MQCLEWNACAGIRRGIAKYIAAVETVCPGWTPRIYDAHAPLRHVETRTSIHRRPELKRDFMERPECLGSFDVEFIRKHHTFPAGTQRKVTDVYKKEPRANHLLPIESADSAGDTMYVGTEGITDNLHVVGGSHAAYSNNRWALPFSASEVDIDLLDQIINE